MFARNSVFGNNFEILRENLRDPARPNFDSEKCLNDLRPVEEIPQPYQEVFAEYLCFNPIQSKLIDDAFYTDQSIVVSAPTGSGKTAIFELAIVRLLIASESSQKFKIVYSTFDPHFVLLSLNTLITVCPMKALCEERLVDWNKKFSNFGINPISVTGDSENIDFQSLRNYNLIITTPEKWDCLTRKWRENLDLVEIVKLFMIDEVHLLNEECRGSTLETIVCRMKTIEESVKTHDLNHKIRFIAVSATIANIEDIAEWNNAKSFKFSDDFRPVRLNKIVLGYSEPPKSTPFKFDLALNYKLHSLMMQYSHGKPTLIFCSTRKIVEMTARHIVQHLTIGLKPEQKQRIVEVASTISDAKAKETLIHGVGYHHAGMLPETRRAIENLFRNNELPVLVTTSTLAMGVNLPAHLVIIKSTKCYTSGGFRDYTETALLQMIGRAGRPQYDTEATALILTTSREKEKFEKMIGGLEPIESNLHRHLIEHLNAEVVLQTITGLEVALRWLTSTFLYIRAKKNPRHYGLPPSSDPAAVDRRLLEMCQIELNKLIKAGMLTIDQDVLLKATPVGAAMAKYYLAFETMKLFTQINGGEILQQILHLISKCSEFSEMYLRVNDKKCLNLLNKCRNRQTIRFPLNGKIKTLDMKINCIIQAVLGCLDICDHSILSETLKIMRNGERIVKCLIEYLESKEKCFQALLSTIILAKCFHVKLWENSPFVSKQLPGIGNVMSSQLVNAGKTSFQLISECEAREIELLINKKPPAGNKILEQIQHLPKYEMELQVHSNTQIKLAISLMNAQDLETKCTVNRNSLMYLLVGDSSNNILLYEKYSHSYFIENPDVVRFVDLHEKNLDVIEAHFISEDWVGIDCTAKYETAQVVRKPEPKTLKKNTEDPTYMQTFIDMYMKCKKNIEPPNPAKKAKIETNEDRNANKIIIHSDISLNNNNTSEEKIVNNSVFRPSPAPEDKIEKIPVLVASRYDLSPSRDKNELNVNNDYQISLKPECEDAKSIVKKFYYTPKKLSHKKEFSWNESEDKPKSTTKITWRSPLTYSPSVKFSPKIGYNRPNENECLSTSRASSSSTNQNIETMSNKTQKSNFANSRTPVKLNSSQQKVVFPLTDKDCANLSMEENSRRNDILEKVGDFASISLFGLVSPTKRQEKFSQIQTPNQYYNQLLSQSEKTESTPKKNKIFEKPKLVENVVKEVCDRSRYFENDSNFCLTPRRNNGARNSENLEYTTTMTESGEKNNTENMNIFEDPFNDSLESALMKFDCGPPSELESDKSNSFDKEGLFENEAKEVRHPFDCREPSPPEMLRKNTNQICRSRFFQPMAEPSHYQNRSDDSFLTQKSHPYPYQSRAPAHMFPISNGRGFETPNDFYKMMCEERPINRHYVDLGQNPYLNISQDFPDRREHYNSQRHLFDGTPRCYPRGHMDDCDGYAYIRRNMDRDYDPFDYRNNPQYYKPVPNIDFYERSQRSFARNRENIPFQDFDLDRSNSYYDESHLPLSYPELPSSQMSRREYYMPSNSFNDVYNNKQLIMQRFLNCVGSDQEKRVNYFP
nr:PREDICTED: probable ATP-dependent DNA helicase HFM1 isoform X3 [Tribolium castaneum]|eukprot:XP_015837991.1 PREDICTED: probable ATP-dependent DNA helicase HFM1 isoform X3 [Tribolium castaneum]